MQSIDQTSSFTLFVNIFLKLGIVLLLIYASFILLKRWQSGKGIAYKKRIVILETTHLTPHRSLHLIQVGGQMMLVGATDQSIILLNSFEEDLAEEIQKSIPQAEQPSPLLNQVPAFASILWQSLSKRS